MKFLFESSICSARSLSKNSTLTPLSKSCCMPRPCISGLGSEIPTTTRLIRLSTILFAHDIFGGFRVVQGSSVVNSVHPSGSMSGTIFSRIVNSACSPAENEPRCALASNFPCLSTRTTPTIGSNLLVCSDCDCSISSIASCMNLRSPDVLVILLSHYAIYSLFCKHYHHRDRHQYRHHHHRHYHHHHYQHCCHRHHPSHK